MSEPSATPKDDDDATIDVHQPGPPTEPEDEPHRVDGDPPDAVAEDDDRGGGPEQRAPDAPDAAT